MAADPQELLTAVDDQLCLALYAASRAITRRYRALLDQLGLTYPQYLVLLVLAEDGRSSLVSIGDRLRLESSTLSPLVRRLESSGLVTRSRSTQDERNVSIELTDSGRQLSLRAARASEEVSRATGLTGAQQSDLVHRLKELESRLRGD